MLSSGYDIDALARDMSFIVDGVAAYLDMGTTFQECVCKISVGSICNKSRRS